MPLAHPDPVTDTEPGLTRARDWFGDRPRQNRAAEREPPARPRLKVFAGEQPVFDGQGGGRGKPMLVVARRQVVPRCHPLDGVPELTTVGLRRVKHDLHECPGPALPRLMEHRLGRGMGNRAETLHAAQVMDAVHAEDSTEPRGRGHAALFVVELHQPEAARAASASRASAAWIRFSETGPEVPSTWAKRLTRSSSIIQRTARTSLSVRRAGGSCSTARR